MKHYPGRGVSSPPGTGSANRTISNGCPPGLVGARVASGQNVLKYLAADIGESHVASPVMERQSFMIQSQQV